MPPAKHYRPEGEIPGPHRPCPRCQSENVRVIGKRPARSRASICTYECLDCGHKMRICGAVGRGSGAYGCCQSYPMRGRMRCRMHGGRHQRGLASPNYNGKGRSVDFIASMADALPDNLAEKYKQAHDDPELLSAKEETALLKARELELVERLQTGEAGSYWKRLQKTYGKLEKAFAAKDRERIAALLTTIGEIIQGGNHREGVWKDLNKAIEHKTRVAEREVRRLHTLHQVMTAEQAIVFVAAMAKAVGKCVTDPEVLKQVGWELRQVLHVGLGALVPVDEPVSVVAARQAEEEGREMERKAGAEAEAGAAESGPGAVIDVEVGAGVEVGAEAAPDEPPQAEPEEGGEPADA